MERCVCCVNTGCELRVLKDRWRTRTGGRDGENSSFCDCYVASAVFKR